MVKMNLPDGTEVIIHDGEPSIRSSQEWQTAIDELLVGFEPDRYVEDWDYAAAEYIIALVGGEITSHIVEPHKEGDIH